MASTRQKSYSIDEFIRPNSRDEKISRLRTLTAEIGLVGKQSNENQRDHNERLKQFFSICHFGSFGIANCPMDVVQCPFLLNGTHLGILIDGCMTVGLRKRIVQFICRGDMIGEMSFLLGLWQNRVHSKTPAIANRKMYGQSASGLSIVALERANIVFFNTADLAGLHEDTRRDIEAYVGFNLVKKTYQQNNLSSIPGYQKRGVIARALLFMGSHFPSDPKSNPESPFSIPFDHGVIQQISQGSSLAAEVRKMENEGFFSLTGTPKSLSFHDIHWDRIKMVALKNPLSAQ